MTSAAGAFSQETSMHTFSTPTPVTLRVELWQGEVVVHARDTATTTVELEPLHGDSSTQDLIDGARVEHSGEEILVLLPKARTGFFRGRGEVRATITVPAWSAARIETGSADVSTDGKLGETNISSGSGDVRIEHAVTAHVRTGSGDIDIDVVEGFCDVKGGSADIEIQRVDGDCSVLSGSGDLSLGRVEGQLKLKTGSGDVVVKEGGDGIDALAGSGDVLVRRVDHGRVQAKTGSGDISVGVARGTAAYLDVNTVTGDVTCSLDAADAPSDDDASVEVLITSGTGDVVLQYA